ncbi:MAG: glutamate 5-kinase [candidate division NC10 bacterium]|nr:glutamate 5-kinase [candidate division NC10 bacterium]MBI2113925.1 glutamate 5-kinase [candidate division NC10 bacterium]MBI2561490.1 glutamate 5-kinase [candidate division NC10 bacterium]
MAHPRRVVVKVGSGVLSRGGISLHRPTVAGLASALAGLRARGVEVILVSSGAILAGMEALGLTERPRDLPLKQATAAVGQSHLMRAYEEAFQPRGQRVAQILLTREDLRHRGRYLNARNTLFTLLRLDIVPIVNENDSVAVQEIQFGDNDTLSALVANLAEADLLLILTDTEGLFTADPRRDPSARLIPLVRPQDAVTSFCAEEAGSAASIGGMSSKVLAARRAATAGIPTVVASGLKEGVLEAVLQGAEEGTFFVPSRSRMQSRKRWLAFASVPRGGIVVDAGARRALVSGGKSLLPSGIRATRRSFRAGDAVSLVDAEDREFARGLANYSRDEVEKIKGLKSHEIAAVLGHKPYDEVVHRDNLVILESLNATTDERR